MNGRVYDPQIGRFLSADTYIQDPYNTQSYNRYSYTINNPLKYTDPDGNFFLAFLAAAITKTIVTNIAMGLIAQMFVAYAVSYAVTYIATGSAKAAQSAGLGAALFMGIGGLRGGKMGANGKMQYNPGWESGSMKTLAAHGLAGGIVQDRMGGSFGAGFLSGSLGSYLGSSGHSKNMSEMIGNTAREAVVGGTISVIGGGKFANGAQTGAFRYLFNHDMHQIIDKLYTEYHGERKTGKVRSLPMGETTVAEYEAVLPFGISGLVPSHMKYSNPLSILLNVLENIWQRQYDVTYESMQKSRLYILDGSSYLLKVDGSRFFMENVTDEVWRREGPLYNGELLRKVDRGMLLRDPPGGW
jgi:hypothetical protein